jgi:hypothetical protein
MAADELTAQPQDVLNMWAGYANLSQYEQTSLLNVASQKIINFCGTTFLQNTYTEDYNGWNNGRIWLRHRPVIMVSQITINNNPSVPNSGTQYLNEYGTDWYFIPKTGELGRGDGMDDQRFNVWFPAGRQNINVTYFAGYPTTPDPVVRATCYYVRYLYERGTSKAMGIFSSESIGDYSYTLNTPMVNLLTMPAQCAELLAEYVQDDVFAFA